METAFYLTRTIKRQQDQIVAMKEKSKLKEMAATMSVPGRTHKDKSRNPPGQDRPGVPDPNKRQKNGQPGRNIGDIKCYNPANPKNFLRLMALPKLTIGPQPYVPFYRDGSQCKNEHCKLAHVQMCALPDQSRKEWFDHVHAQPHLHFNMKTCK